MSRTTSRRPVTDGADDRPRGRPRRGPGGAPHRRADRPGRGGPRGAGVVVPEGHRRGAALPRLRQRRAAAWCASRRAAGSSRDMKAGPLKERNQRLLRRCDFGSIQSAINTIKARNTSIYVLPGTYRERKWASDERSEYCSNLETDSNDPLDEVDYIGSVPDPEGGTPRSPTRSRCPTPTSAAAPTTSTSSRCSATRRPEERLDRLRQPLLRHPDRRHRQAPHRRAHQERVQQAQRAARRPDERPLPAPTSPSRRRSSTPSTSWRATAS